MGDDYTFDEEAADRACRFFPRYLRHVKGDWYGQPFELADWQEKRIIRPLFGCKRADGTRQYRTVSVWIPRKNGKSAIAAGIAVKLTFADHEPGAEVYSAAADRQQAGIVFETAKKMVQLSKPLRRRSRVLRRSITVGGSGSFYQVLSADARTKHGFNAHGVVIDELHAHQGDRQGSLFEVLTTAQGSRRQAVVVTLSTAGFDRRSIAYHEYRYACQVRDGVIEDPSYLPVIFEADPKEDDPGDPATWSKANPNLGVSLYVDYLRDKWRRAQGMPAEENTFRRLHLNIWTEQATAWIPLDKWDSCRDDELTLDDLEGRPCCGGLDLSTTEDISAFVLAFELDDGRVAIFPWYWIPRETAAERSRKERIPYLRWIDQGLVRATEGNVIDYDVIRRDINEIGQRFQVDEIAYDPWNATQIATQLEGDGFELVKHPQNFRSLAEPTQEFQRRWKSAGLAHDGNPVLRYQAAQVAVKQNTDGFLKPAKDLSGDRIDGIVAGIMAVGRLVLDPGGIDGADDIVRRI